MGAKDTVISRERIRMILHEQDEKGQRDNMFRLESLVKAQAEISFRAGANEEARRGFERCAMTHEDGRKEGRQEVVEFFIWWQFGQYGSPIKLDIAWQAKLKDWGIKRTELEELKED